MYPTAISYLMSFPPSNLTLSFSSSSTSNANSKSIFARIPNCIARMIYDLLNPKEQAQMKAVCTLCERKVEHLLEIQGKELAYAITTEVHMGYLKEANELAKQIVAKYEKYKAPVPAEILDAFAYVKLELFQYLEADELFAEAIIKFGGAVPPMILANAAFVKLRRSGLMREPHYREAYELFNQVKVEYGALVPAWVEKEANIAQTLCERDDMQQMLSDSMALFNHILA